MSLLAHLVELVHPAEARAISRQRLQDNCTVFQQDIRLLDHPYALKSKVGINDFRDFVAALEDRPVRITVKNFPGLFRLSDEFGFDVLSGRLLDFLRRGRVDFRDRLSSLSEGQLLRERQILALERSLAARIDSEAELSASLGLVLDRLSRLESSAGILLSEVERLKGIEIAAHEEIGSLRRSLAAVEPGPTVSADGRTAPLTDSLIAPSFPFLDGCATSSSPWLKLVVDGPGREKIRFVNRLRDHCSGTSEEDRPPSTSEYETIRYRESEYRIWNTAGTEGLRPLLRGLFRGAAGVFLLFDVTSQDSFDTLRAFLCDLPGLCPRARILLVGDKAHRTDQRQVSAEEARRFAAERGFGYAEASAKTGDGVIEAFEQMHSMLWRPGCCPLLWRGSRDGFSAAEFHRRCDGRERTLTLIRDLNGNIFGGFAAPSWESPFFAKTKADGKSESFLFTLRNPFNLDPQQFKLSRGRESSAIRVSSKICGCFGDDDLLINDGCNVNSSHSRGLGSTYQNGTGIDGRFVFSGSETFIVKEIEVFEVKCDPLV
jgi:hypothetical protein